MLNRFRNVVKNLTVFPENMRRNIDKTFGVIFSQRVLLALIEKGLSREDAYGIVQPLAMKAWETEVHFRDLLQANDIVKEKSTEAELDRKSTRQNSSHVAISYAVFCLKKKDNIERLMI